MFPLFLMIPIYNLYKFKFPFVIKMPVSVETRKKTGGVERRWKKLKGEMSNWKIRGEGPLSICEREREEERKWCSPCSSLSARCSRWLSRVEGAAGPQGALGTPSALQWARSPPSQHSPNTQASAIKTTPNKHTPNTLTTWGGWAGCRGELAEAVQQRVY